MPPYDATVVARLRAAGLVPLGKTNMDEFAMGSSTEHSAYGPTHNPWDLDRIPGGSGGGSAAAVAAFEAPLALGTDTGGSIRQPAHVTGTVGVKPTYGGVSAATARSPWPPSLDQVGPVTRTVLDAALLHDVIGGHDPHDSTSLRDALAVLRRCRGAAGRRARACEIGVIKELARRGLPGRRLAALPRVARAAARRRAPRSSRSAPRTSSTRVAAYYLILPAEASSNLAKFDSRALRPAGRRPRAAAPSRTSWRPPARPASATRSSAASSSAPTRCRPATTTPTTARRRRCARSIQRDFDAAFAQVDVLATPTAPTTAFKLGEKIDDPLAMYLNDVATIPANLAGVPGDLDARPDSPPRTACPSASSSSPRRARTPGSTASAPRSKPLLVDQWGGPLLDQAPDARPMHCSRPRRCPLMAGDN